MDAQWTPNKTYRYLLNNLNVTVLISSLSATDWFRRRWSTVGIRVFVKTVLVERTLTTTLVKILARFVPMEEIHINNMGIRSSKYGTVEPWLKTTLI